jgi:hypothetical protein
MEDGKKKGRKVCKERRKENITRKGEGMKEK